jgi:hypothetical protein
MGSMVTVGTYRTYSVATTTATAIVIASAVVPAVASVDLLHYIKKK